MEEPIITPTSKGTICPALYKENYEYMLSGDCEDFCLCILNDQPCLGRIIDDPEDRSSRFFSRGKCMIDTEEIKKCPSYNMPKSFFINFLREKSRKDLTIKLNHLNGGAVPPWEK